VADADGVTVGVGVADAEGEGEAEEGEGAGEDEDGGGEDGGGDDRAVEDGGVEDGADEDGGIVGVIEAGVDWLPIMVGAGDIGVVGAMLAIAGDDALTEADTRWLAAGEAGPVAGCAVGAAAETWAAGLD
jgi:hypothetical protein